MYRLIIIGVMISSIVGGVLYKISTLNATVSELKTTIATRDKSITNLKLSNKLNAVEVNNLNGVIANQNSKITNTKISYKKNLLKLTKELSKKPKVIYKKVYEKIYPINDDGSTVDYAKASCEEGLRLNAEISTIKFKEL